MAIFRGEGGAGASDTNATVSLVTQQAVIATTKASAAASHATDASTHADTATAQATAAANSVAVAANISTGVQTYSDAAVASAALAVTAKTNAETAETNAETAESNASTHATTATTKASEAVTSASSASTSASSASSSASTASTHATNAATSASTSSTQASNAASSATAAETAKTNAETAKTNAETAETNAASSATAASISATSVATSATNATTQATAAAASAATASTAVTTVVDTYKSATPTLSSSEVNKITVTNHSSYASPVYIVKLGDAVIQHTIASNVITLVGVTLSEQTISVTVTVSEAGLGKLFSNATVSMVVTDASPTPALSITGLTNRKIQVTNHASYGSGIVYTAKIGSTVVSHTMDSDTIILADNTSFASDQTVAITASVNGGTSSAGANATVDMGGANYQYYRLINILAVQGSTGVALSEIALSDGFTANYNSFTTGLTNVTASYSHASYPVSNVTGATPGYWWSVHGHNNTSTWVKFSFSQATVAKALRLRAASSTYIATTFKFQGSNDDVNWTDIGTFGAPQYNHHTVTHDINKD